MDIQKWLRERAKPASLDGVALRMWRDGRPYAQLENRLRQRYLLEALIANDGSQVLAAKQLGISRAVLWRAIRLMGLTSKDVRNLAKAVKAARQQ